MKTTLLTLLIAATVTSASAITIAQWTFETSVPTTAGPLSPEHGNGTATASHTSGLTVYSNPVGNGSAESWSSDRWAIGDYYQFRVSTVGYQNIILSWDQAGSATGPKDFTLQYSINGTIFSDFVNYSVILSGFSSSSVNAAVAHSHDLSGVASIVNASDVYFRLTDRSNTAINGGTVATGGTSRVDNFTVSGTLITSAVPDTGATALLLSIPLLGLLALHRFAPQNALVPARKFAFASIRVD